MRRYSDTVPGGGPVPPAAPRRAAARRPLGRPTAPHAGHSAGRRLSRPTTRPDVNAPRLVPRRTARSGVRVVGDRTPSSVSASAFRRGSGAMERGRRWLEQRGRRPHPNPCILGNLVWFAWRCERWERGARGAPRGGLPGRGRGRPVALRSQRTRETVGELGVAAPAPRRTRTVAGAQIPDLEHLEPASCKVGSVRRPE